MARPKKIPEPPCDPDDVIRGDLVTAAKWPHHTKYRKLVLVTGTVQDITEDCCTLLGASGYATIRKRDIQRIKKVAV